MSLHGIHHGQLVASVVKHNSTMHPMQVSRYPRLHDASCKAYISSHTHYLVYRLLEVATLQTMRAPCLWRLFLSTYIIKGSVLTTFSVFVSFPFSFRTFPLIHPPLNYWWAQFLRQFQFAGTRPTSSTGPSVRSHGSAAGLV